VRIHSDAPFIGILDVTEDHTFSCDVEFDLPPMTKHTETSENPNYSYRLNFTDRATNKSPTKFQFEMFKPYNSMRIDKSFWEEGKEYEFRCTVTEYTKYDESAIRGSATKYFSTATYPGYLKFIIAPSIGLPFKTDFLLESKHMWARSLRCQFGYYNLLGKVVIDEQKDFSDKVYQIKARFPSMKSEKIRVFVKCWD